MAFLPSCPLVHSRHRLPLSSCRRHITGHQSISKAALLRPSCTTPCMGLNAKNMAKNKKKSGKKKARSTSAAATTHNGTPPRAKANMIDTNRREYIYQMVGVSKTLNNGKQILNNINLAYFPGVKIGVVGSNGSGKSSLLKIMAGLDSEYDGIAAPQSGINIGYLAQEPVLEEDTVEANIANAVTQPRAWLERYAELGKMIGEEGLEDTKRQKITAEWESLQNKIEAANAWELDRNIDRAREALRCPPGDARVETLSGGEKRRVALCALLLTRPELLILDEPTNHLDALSVLWLERFLETYKGTVICVTHDRFFLEALTDWILEIDNGQGFPYEGNYSTYLEKKAKRMEQEEKVASSRQKLIRQELEWIRSSPKGQQAKSKARISRYESLLEEDARSSKQSTLDRIYIPPGPKLGDIVVEADGVRKGFGENVLFENMSFSLPRGGIVGVIGPNGSGKTTLLRMIMGEESPDAGVFKVGESVIPMYADQSRGSVDRQKSVFETVSDGNDELQLGTRSVKSRAYLSWFNFKGGDQQKPVDALSGGELNRLALAQVVKGGGNLLLGDELTNDADAFLIRSLEEALLSFAGCAVIVSHDIAFLNRVATHILAFEGDLVPGQVTFFEGNFSAYLEDKRKRFGDTTPSRMKFAKLPTV
eukprot:TRINITY_DN572_c0_g1_i4.p1 TRINITY_DN572_c0_g1~~TRINITY_DN572_c0_g1_i4.p1  ORF type:complete len:652 (-),score=112.84 TRINITY_DN572_c0_g1_i4:3920-5875(-)